MRMARLLLEGRADTPNHIHIMLAKYLKTPRSLTMLMTLFIFLGLAAVNAFAEADAPSLEDRVADLEAYINNTAPALNTVTPGPGHNGWIMTSALLVLFMTLPGLALFYGGLVRAKNVLSVLAQCLGIAGMVTILWWAVGYSLVFGTSFKDTIVGPILGGSEYFFFNGVDSVPNGNYAYWVSHNVWAMFQLMFAIITPALMIGAIAERMKYSAVMSFILGWMFLVYIPLAHMTWGATGLMNGVWNAGAAIQSIDFAGGTVVHMSSGWSALLLCIILGKRMGFGSNKMAPHSLVLCMVGTGMLWVGWYGFNAGSAVAADGVSSNAFTTTTLAAAIAGFTWGAMEWIFRGKASVLGICSGIVAGLVVITPACGFVTPSASVLLGVVAGVVPFLACTKLKNLLGYDDALDTFGVHGVGGTMGALLTGLCATSLVNGNLKLNLGEAGNLDGMLWLEQLKSMGLTIAISLAATAILAYGIKALIGLRPSQEVEHQGLDINDHGEQGYIYGDK